MNIEPGEVDPVVLKVDLIDPERCGVHWFVEEERQEEIRADMEAEQVRAHRVADVRSGRYCETVGRLRHRVTRAVNYLHPRQFKFKDYFL